ncbi:MAG: Sua5/YciO/YrdC/YwlC family protein, partial [Nitrososphaerota archaeon]
MILSPTDTVYGLLTDATFKEAVKKVFMIKQRNYDKKIPIFVKDITMAKKIARISKKTEAFLKKIWPGKVTVVLRRNKRYKIYGVDK